MKIFSLINIIKILNNNTDSETAVCICGKFSHTVRTKKIGKKFSVNSQKLLKIQRNSLNFGKPKTRKKRRIIIINFKN